MKSRTRLDKFTSVNNTVRITARPDHTFKTEQYIASNFNIELRIDSHIEEEDEQKDYFDEDIVPFQGERFAHFPSALGELTFSVRPSLQNHCLKKTYIRPQTSNVLDVLPREQLQLLPYITEDHKISQLSDYSNEVDTNELSTIVADISEIRIDGAEASPDLETAWLRYDGTISSHLFVSRLPLIADDAQNQNGSIEPITVLNHLEGGSTNKTRLHYLGDAAGINHFEGVATAATDGLIGIPLRYSAQTAAGADRERPLYECNLTQYGLSIDSREFGHALDAVNLDDQVFRFAFQAGSSIGVKFDESGFGTTYNSSLGGTAAGDELIKQNTAFMIFKIWHRGAPDHGV